MSNRLHLVRGRQPSERKAAECFLDEALQFWQPRYDRKLSCEDARQIKENLAGFFRVLERWQNTNDAKVTAVESYDDEQAA